MNSHLRGRKNICQYSALPHLQRSFRDTEDDKDPYRPTQMSGPKNKTRKMNGIRKNRVIATEKPRWKTMYKLHSFRRRKTSTQAQSNLRNHSKRIPLTLRSIIPIQRSSFAFIPSTLNSTSLHFLLNSILIAEATMALLHFTLFLTILLSVGQTTRQTDEEEPTNVSCSIVFPTSVDLDPLAKSSVSDEVVPDR